jgi:hypothetical protein
VAAAAPGAQDCSRGAGSPVSEHRALDERRGLWTAKPCGSGIRCWCQVGGGVSALPGPANLQSADDGGKTNSSPGRARNKPLKPLRRECRCDAGEPVVTTVCLLPLHTGRGCIGHPAFPTPSWAGISLHNPGASCRGNAKPCQVPDSPDSGEMSSMSLHCRIALLLPTRKACDRFPRCE